MRNVYYIYFISTNEIGIIRKNTLVEKVLNGVPHSESINTEQSRYVMLRLFVLVVVTCNSIK